MSQTISEIENSVHGICQFVFENRFDERIRCRFLRITSDIPKTITIHVYNLNPLSNTKYCLIIQDIIIIIIQTYLKAFTYQNACQVYAAECVSKIINLHYPLFNVWGYVSSAYPILLWWSWECVLYLIIIIKPEVWIIYIVQLIPEIT